MEANDERWNGFVEAFGQLEKKFNDMKGFAENVMSDLAKWTDTEMEEYFDEFDEIVGEKNGKG